MVLEQFVEEFPQQVTKHLVNATLCPSRQKYSIQLVVNSAKFSNLAVVYRSRVVEKCNWDCPIRVKAKSKYNVVVLGPSIVVMILDIRCSH